VQLVAGVPGDLFTLLKDVRVRQVIHPPDPRIHFALVCGAKSCPPIKVNLLTMHCTLFPEPPRDTRCTCPGCKRDRHL
jgi:hypothetical protein